MRSKIKPRFGVSELSFGSILGFGDKYIQGSRRVGEGRLVQAPIALRLDVEALTPRPAPLRRLVYLFMIISNFAAPWNFRALSFLQNSKSSNFRICILEARNLNFASTRRKRRQCCECIAEADAKLKPRRGEGAQSRRRSGIKSRGYSATSN